MLKALLRMLAFTAILCPMALGFDDSDAVLQRFLKRIRADLDHLPNLVCTQDVDRFHRRSDGQPWIKVDTLHLEVAAFGDQELYTRAGERAFQSKPLAGVVSHGTVGTGQFANFARQVFGGQPSNFEFKSRTEQDGVTALEFTFDIDASRSGYKLRSSNVESVVAFQGSFSLAANTLDLLRLDVQAYDIPDKLGIAEADTTVEYARIDIDGSSILLPRMATLTITATDGGADRNHSRLASCRQYRTESTVRFDALRNSETIPAPTAPAPEHLAVAGPPDRIVLELALESPLNPSTIVLGDSISAKLLNPIKHSSGVLIPQGSRITGRIVRLDRLTLPYPAYEIGLEFHTANTGDRSVPLFATMIDAGPAAGLIRQQRRLEPTFTRQRTNRMDILVREVQQGQGILTWDARRGSVPAGLKMKWRLTTTPDIRE